MEPIVKNEIRFDLVCRLIKDNWKGFLKVMAIMSVITYLMLLCVPRYYSVKVMLAPEYGEQSTGGTLGAAASMLGISVPGAGADAIAPEFYPDIIQSTDFLVPIMETAVETNDGSFKGTYGNYILKKEKYPWWTKLYAKVKSWFVPKPAPYAGGDGEYKVDPFKLTMAEYNLLQRVQNSIGCEVSQKTGVITLTVKAQDPLVAATVANAVKGQMQTFMTRYRTEKNKVEYKHAVEMCDTAYVKYMEAQKRYAEYVDKHQGLSKQLYKIEEERLAGEMQLAFNIYNSLYQQKLLSESEVQKRTPAFTVLQNATVPVKPAGPRRLLITVIMAFVSALIYLIRLILKERKKRKAQILENIA